MPCDRQRASFDSINTGLRLGITSTGFQIDRIAGKDVMLTRVEAAVAGSGYVVLGRVSKAFPTLTAEPIKLAVGCAAMGAVHLLLHMWLKDIGGGTGQAVTGYLLMLFGHL